VAHVALSGGTTPGRAYELLGEKADELEGVEVWFADERCVGPQDEESNYRLVEQTLLAGSAIAPERVHRMVGELGPDEGASEYAQELRQKVAGEGEGSATLPVLDLVVKPPPERITLSLEVLRAARECLLLATGASKADATSAMLGEPSPHVPASLLRRGRLTLIVDDAAAPEGP